MSRYPANRGFTGTLRPVRMEGDILDLEIEGDVPSQLSGTYHRVHPDQQFPPKYETDQFFNGDGMVSLFRFRHGVIDFKQRYVQTDKWKLERAAGRALFGAYRNPLTDDDSVKGRIRGTANTNVMVHAGQLYAMKEDSPCFLLDPLTLDSRGYTDFNGKLQSQTFCAHPKIDPRTGHFCGFGYATRGLLTLDMCYFEIDPRGKLVKEIPFQNKYYCMMHDFAITADYAIFHTIPIVSSWERLQANLPHFGFDTTLPIYVGVLPREGTERDMRWFTAPNCFASHVMNAFQDGTKLHFDVPEAKGNVFPFFPDIHGKAFDPVAARPYLTRWTLDLGSRSDQFHSRQRLSDWIDEFPRIDDRYAGSAYRHGWMLVMDPDMPFEGTGGRMSGFVMNRIAHVDLRNGTQDSWWAGPQSICQEPCFIPRQEGAAEGDGYIVAVVDNLVTNYSDLVILDALKLSEGPIARARLPIRLRSGLHGNWADESRLQEV